MGLREQAKLDARAILEDTLGFAWPVTLTSPLGVVTSVYGFTTDVGQTIDPETGQAVAGQRASCTVALGALPSLPEAVAEGSRKPWLATFADSQGVFGAWKVVEVLPDRAAGVVVLLLEVFKRAIVHLTGALMLPSLQLAGTVDPVVPVSGELVLPSLQLAGSVAPQVELSGALQLPSLQLAGTVAPQVQLGGSLALPSLQLAGTVAPQVQLSGALQLPSLQLSGSVSPQVQLSGSLTLPSLQLSGSLTTGTSIVSAMLVNSTVGAISSLPDLLNGSNPATQAVGSRQPTGNADLTVSYSGTNVLVWPLAANNSQTGYTALCGWFKFTSVAAATQRLFAIGNGAGGATVRRLVWQTSTNKMQNVIFTVDGSGNRINDSPAAALSAGVYLWLRFVWDQAGATDADKIRNYIANVLQTANLSGTGTLGAGLQATTGNALLGNFTNDGVFATPFTGTHGRRLYWLSAEPTAAQDLALQNYDKPV